MSTSSKIAKRQVRWCDFVRRITDGPKDWVELCHINESLPNEKRDEVVQNIKKYLGKPDTEVSCVRFSSWSGAKIEARWCDRSYFWEIIDSVMKQGFTVNLRTFDPIAALNPEEYANGALLTPELIEQRHAQAIWKKKEECQTQGMGVLAFVREHLSQRRYFEKDMWLSQAMKDVVEFNLQTRNNQFPWVDDETTQGPIEQDLVELPTMETLAIRQQEAEETFLPLEERSLKYKPVEQTPTLRQRIAQSYAWVDCRIPDKHGEQRARVEWNLREELTQVRKQVDAVNDWRPTVAYSSQ